MSVGMDWLAVGSQRDGVGPTVVVASDTPVWEDVGNKVYYGMVKGNLACRGIEIEDAILLLSEGIELRLW